VSDRPPLDLTCYVHEGWRPRIRAASHRRAWMDATPDAFAYRCLPLNIANAHGWELLSPCGFEAEWNGGPAVEDVAVRADPSAEPRFWPVALFGQGVLSFHVEGLFRTPPGVSLWVGGPPNAAKDAIAPLSGLIETDWSPYSFTMNWRFTRKNQWVRFSKGDPFCFIAPVKRQAIEDFAPQLKPLSADPQLMQTYEDAKLQRNFGLLGVKSTERFQGWYSRGLRPDGSGEAFPEHRTKSRPRPFERG